MKKIIHYLLTHIRQDFTLRTYGLVTLFLIVSISFNYYVDLEDSIIDSYVGSPQRYLWYFLLYSFSYYGTIGILRITGQLSKKSLDKNFWVYSLFGMLVLSIEPEFSYSVGSYVSKLDSSLYYWNYKLAHELAPLVCTLIPLALFYVYYRPRPETFYGLTFYKVDLKPYFIMWLIMIPPIIWASFQPDFLETYPTYRSPLPDEQLGLPKGVLAFIYELAYGSAFVMTELIFRGFLVIGIAVIIGKEAILPMVVTYAFLHFGKPLGETIGAIFGGYILGVIALYSRNIWGGVAIHLGVAWLMEVAAWIQKGLK
ncbi:CPBP family intramembrane glutamic endopeptidase [Xanthocytophaga agilis]|uniref:CPBP family intramembrane metalloprotease n=1 Tax=Xanthocytophaga agilis TaxID=3048010 RepID=A0AAE3QYC5_9BACT|nr:CPBP family intramembrane glutamic endopeptidase [Xanthocytophaga agilis]MDJ1499730.1 CPBP family intramembrane metalloprotease [Xanthocytophaga agilis]